MTLPTHSEKINKGIIEANGAPSIEEVCIEFFSFSTIHLIVCAILDFYP